MSMCDCVQQWLSMTMFDFVWPCMTMKTSLRNEERYCTQLLGASQNHRLTNSHTLSSKWDSLPISPLFEDKFILGNEKQKMNHKNQWRKMEKLKNVKRKMKKVDKGKTENQNKRWTSWGWAVPSSTPLKLATH